MLSLNSRIVLHVVTYVWKCKQINPYCPVVPLIICDPNCYDDSMHLTISGTEQCEPNPCLHGGHCRYIGETGQGDSEYMCDCAGNYVGDACQYESEIWSPLKFTIINTW